VSRGTRLKKRILSISYDKVLLLTRHELLKQEGFEVRSAYGFAEAMEACRGHDDFDVVVMGHSMPRKDKTALVRALRIKCDAPLVSILKPGDPTMPQADYSVDAHEGPKALLEAVRKASHAKRG
jgi:CheY-like chemotaxis protein